MSPSRYARMVIEHQPDDRLRRVLGVNLLEPRDELDAMVPILGMSEE